MCTAILYRSSGSFLGRTLDHANSYGEAPVIIRKGRVISLRHTESVRFKADAIAMGIEKAGFPLLFDGVNEFGVAIAGLNLPISSKFYEPRANFLNLASYEVIPYILASATTADEAREILTRVNITPDKFDTDTPAPTLHFMIADRRSSFIAEQTEGGVAVYDDSYGVLTNEPTYPAQCVLMHRYRGISNDIGENAFTSERPLSYGEGSLGLPGDLSSASRFARAAFGIRFGASDNKNEALAAAVHTLESVSVIKGTASDGGRDYKTVYTSVMDLDDFSYHYRRYSDTSFTQISPWHTRAEDKDS